jgi:hypothetical protein
VSFVKELEGVPADDIRKVMYENARFLATRRPA